MQSIESYRGREQTYLKHYVLENYLERLAYNVGFAYDEIVYIDGFSGPWRSEDRTFEDTSFMIAIETLRRTRESLARHNKAPGIRCLFIEQKRKAFRALEQAVAGIEDFEILPLRGRFEDNIDAARRFAGNGFTLTFIDPTGWEGFGLERIAPLLLRRGEVIVNFMFDHINRFLDRDRAKLKRTFDELFGGGGWEPLVELAGPGREEALIQLYCSRLRKAGGFDYATSARILQPTSDRAYFHLVYATRHWKGLFEFRGVERRLVEEQARVRAEAKEISRVERTGQPSLFDVMESAKNPGFYDAERATNLALARGRIERKLSTLGRIQYDSVLATALELRLVWPGDIQAIIKALQERRLVEVQGLRPRERTLKHNHVIRWLGERRLAATATPSQR